AAISRRAETDDLTGLYNRAGFRARMSLALGLANLPVTLALIDVDHFKAINDSHGHAAGDIALAEIARRLRAGTREIDVVGRLGGDEFAILFRCGIESAWTVCERIAHSITAEPIMVNGNVVVLTSISCGLAPLREGLSRETLFEAADLA
ncbi:GGDEF domain-containing protein, partial [Vibrio parahaemolyticus]